MIYSTVEVRWFWPGDVPRPVLDWLSGWPVPPEVQPVRVDHYARLPEPMRRTVGIKLREGRLEVKWRQQDRALVWLAPGVMGSLGSWRKQISLSSEVGDRQFAGLAPGGDSTAVEKLRRLARFWVTDEGQVTSVQPPEPDSGACEFEVTTVHALDEVWWTVCFEALGADESSLESTLRRVAAHVLAPAHPLTLAAEHSLSYPQWLAGLDPAR